MLRKQENAVGDREAIQVLYKDRLHLSQRLFEFHCARPFGDWPAQALVLKLGRHGNAWGKAVEPI